MLLPSKAALNSASAIFLPPAVFDNELAAKGTAESLARLPSKKSPASLTRQPLLTSVTSCPSGPNGVASSAALEESSSRLKIAVNPTIVDRMASDFRPPMFWKRQCSENSNVSVFVMSF